MTRKFWTKYLLISLLVSCGHPRPPSPMRSEEIRSTRKLSVAYLNYDADTDASDLLTCPQKFPSIDVLEEKRTRRLLRSQGLPLDRLLEFGDQFDLYQAVSEIQLLLITFSKGEKIYLRSVNFLSRVATTVLLDTPTLRCEDVIRASRLVSIDSLPPMADVILDDRMVGEAPLWAYLKDGEYEINCKLPEETFRAFQFTVPKEISILCQREGSKSQKSAEEKDDVSTEEGIGAALVYIAGALATAAAVLIPILLFF